MKNFVLIGAAGYIAPRHLQAIKETGNNLIAALDPFDSVGILDSYFPSADFFTEFERFDRHIEKLKRQNVNLDYVTVCSPNYLHDAHIRFGLRHGADVICEKPIVLNPWNLDALGQIEKETGKRVFTILQLRLHPSVIELKRRIDSAPESETFDVNLEYVTSRGKWYQFSWKGDQSKSGGIATNIGVHFFDMLTWIFGDVLSSEVHFHNSFKCKGLLVLRRAQVNWGLSIDEADLPDYVRARGERTYRAVSVNGDPFEFSDGFTGLHTKCYDEILRGNGFGIEENKRAIKAVYHIRPSNGCIRDVSDTKKAELR